MGDKKKGFYEMEILECCEISEPWAVLLEFPLDLAALLEIWECWLGSLCWFFRCPSVYNPSLPEFRRIPQVFLLVG